MDIARIFHGGRAGKGAVGFSNPPDRLVDNAGLLLLLGQSGELDVSAPFIYASGDVIALSDGYIDISANGNITIYSSGSGSVTFEGVNAKIKSTSGNVTIETVTGRIMVSGIKSGATQGAAGAIANELWHCTTDHTIRIGI